MSIDVRVKLVRADFTLDAEFIAPATGFTAVFGRSGAGKTTLMRIIAGLEKATGSVSVDGESWLAGTTSLPAHKRALGYVFQEASLFEHLNVQGNLEYGYQRIDPADRTIDFEQVLEVLQLNALLARRVQTLSGGERQRVAIGRALLTSPKLLLFDEPLASLDIQHRREIMPFLEKLCAEFRIPAIYVSHTPDEVARLADHLVLLDAGQVTAAGPVNEILSRLDLPLAHDQDAGTVIETTVANYESGFDLSRLSFSGGEIMVAGEHQQGGAVRLRILARDVSVSLERHTDTSILNIIPVVVREIETGRGAQATISLDAEGHILLARITRRSVERLKLEPGKHVFAQIKAVALLN